MLFRSRSGSLASLSDRELQVLQYITSARTPTQIAEHLGLSVKTVSTYRTRILEKLDLETTAELMQFGMHHQLGVPREAGPKEEAFVFGAA